MAWGTGPSGAAVAAWPTVALLGSYELLMMVIRGSQVVQDGVPCKVEARDPLQEQAVVVFAGQPRAQRLRACPGSRQTRSGGRPQSRATGPLDE